LPSIHRESNLEKHKVDDAVTAYKKYTNDIQRSEEEDNKQQQSTATIIK
jgi:hypothetical protein